MKAPQISIVMSCYNCSDTLERAIQSVLNQSFKNFEFIIIEDGSTDQTKALLYKIGRTDSRIRILENQKNLGLSASLNKGIRQAKAELVARMDADDECNPNRLAVQFQFINSNPQVDVVGSGILLRGRNGVALGNRVLPETDKEIKSRIFKKPLLYHPTILIRKSVYENIGYYNDELKWAEDADLWYRIYDKITFANVQEYLLIYTVKDKLSIKSAATNFKVKFSNLKKRGLLLRFTPQLIYDVLLLSSKVVYYRP